MKALKIVCLLGLIVAPVFAKERRAAPPRFGADSFRGVFFEDLSESVAASRPSVQALRGIMPRAAGPAAGEPQESEDAGGGWGKLASAQSIEDEIKRQKLKFDADVSQPGAFKSGGYVNARTELSILATLFGVVTLYEGDIRWKEQAEAARNLLARTAGNCNSGSIQVFNECKTRKQDLDDLLGGGSLSGPPAKAESDWPMIADRSVLMGYLETLSKEELPNLTNDDTGVKETPDKVKQFSDMVALVGNVLIQEGMDEADDEEYVKLSKQMLDAAILAGQAAKQGDADGARKAVGMINQSCDACHEQYR
ncbi:Cytochrome C' [Rosistilla carotiformis]|uniref:Cytochrome C n=1 Tax=Rosistilla carotiformis TaxID=2528017 RepID=A0A518JSS3_9BACT|nr:cytochrome c [Rosistilla carotiformis]QDV68582.1 Cytochrome C' [Rosistilla carotiformis]